MLLYNGRQVTVHLELRRYTWAPPRLAVLERTMNQYLEMLYQAWEPGLEPSGMNE